MTNIRIKGIAVYHPENVVENQYYIDHFVKQGRDITDFLTIMGKKKRFIINDEKENGLTMGIEASKKVLKQTGLTGEDVDMIVFSTQVPEYTMPTNASLIHNAIQGAPEAIVQDSNANCAGMTVAVEQTSRYMMSNPYIKRALVVGSDYLSAVANPEQEISYAMFGDAASAVILEKTEEDTGFIDAMTHVETMHIDKILYPEAGLAQTLKGKADGRFLRFDKFDASFNTPIINNLIEGILKRNGLSTNDVGAFCFSQFAYADSVNIQENFNIDWTKIIYVGDKYGYTGTSSPFIALYEAIQDERVKRGDYILFWTVGAGHEFISMLFKY